MTIITDTLTNYNPETFKAQPILDFFNEKYPNASTRQVVLSKFKRQLLEKTPVPDFKNGHEYNVIMRKAKKLPVLLPAELNLLRLPKDVQKTIKTKQQESLGTKLNEVQELKNSKQFFKDITDGLKSKSFDTLLPALLLVSGRRTTEILKTAMFSKGKKGYIKFTGKLKSFDIIEYEIPILTNSRLFKRALMNLRKVIPEVVERKMTNTQVQEEYSYRIKKIFDAMSSKYDIKLTAHSMRSLYIAFAAKKYQKKTQTNIGFAKEVLCHMGNNDTLHYISYKLA